MPIQRLTDSGELQDVEIPGIVKSQAERQEALLAEAQKNREAASYAGLVRQPRSEPLTAQEIEMSEKSKEQLEREAVHTSGPRFDEIARQQKEKLEVENAVTAHAGVVKMGDGQVTRLIPTPENYALEQGERSEGIDSPDLPPLAIATGVPSTVGLNKMDEAELKLRTGEQGSETSAQHATGTSTAGQSLAQGKPVEAVSPRSDKELEKLESKGEQVAAKAAKEDATARAENPNVGPNASVAPEAPKDQKGKSSK